MTLRLWLTYLLGSLTCESHSPALLNYSFLLMLVLVLQWLSLHWEILIMFLSQFPLTFQQPQNGMFHGMFQRGYL